MAGKWVSSGSLANVWVIPAAAPAAAYIGPGDVVTGAVGWWGLRGYNNAVSNGATNAVRLRRDGDNTEQDFVILTNGDLDMASIATFFAGGAPASSNLFITTLYDQSGNGSDVSQAVAANQPKFALSVLGAFPAIQSVVASNTYMSGTYLGPTTAQPNSGSSVIWYTNGTGLRTDIFLLGVADYISGANYLIWDASFGHPVNTCIAYGALYTTPNANLYQNGVAGAPTAMSNALAFTNSDTLAFPFRNGLVGDVMNIFEFGLWSGDQSANFAALSNNQTNYWGF